MNKVRNLSKDLIESKVEGEIDGFKINNNDFFFENIKGFDGNLCCDYGGGATQICCLNEINNDNSIDNFCDVHKYKSECGGFNNCYDDKFNFFDEIIFNH